ncbi:colicin M resistance protein CbrA, partial [Escherichia coli]
ALTSAFSRKWIMRSGVAHIPQGDHSAPQIKAETGQIRRSICP